MSKANAVVAVFDTHQRAEDAIKNLQRSGFDMKNLSIVAKGYSTEEQPVGFYTTGDRVTFWGGTGALWGSLWGLLFGAALFWVPGIGPLVVGGQLVAILVGALEGAVVVGGLSALAPRSTASAFPRTASLSMSQLSRPTSTWSLPTARPPRSRRLAPSWNS